MGNRQAHSRVRCLELNQGGSLSHDYEKRGHRAQACRLHVACFRRRLEISGVFSFPRPSLLLTDSLPIYGLEFQCHSLVEIIGLWNWFFLLLFFSGFLFFILFYYDFISFGFFSLF